MPVNTTIKIRKGTESEWQSSNPILASGEPGYVTNTNRFKIGDGSTNWNSLSYTAVVPSGFLAGSGINIVLGSQGISATIGVSGLSTSYLSDFNSAVSGLLPVKDIVAGTGISVSSSNQIYTINSTGAGVLADQAKSLITTVFNKTGSVIPKMTAVYISGGQGDLPSVGLAIATSDMTSAGTYGLTYESISNMNSGKVIVFGALSGLNTDQFNPNAPTGDVNGSILYLSPTTSGALTTTKPYAPYHVVTIGTIVRTHQNEGVIEVRIQNGFELEELHNVAISGVTNGQFLQYNSASGLWMPSSSGNFTSLSLNGTTVSIVGHTHTSSDITNFNSSVSGLLPTISNSGDNKLLTSTGSTVGINAESNLTFDGNLLNITGSGSFSSNLRINNQTSNTIAGFDANKNISSLSTSTYPNLTELSYVKDVTSSIQTQLNNKAALVHTHVVNDITDFATGVANEVDTTLVATTGIDLNYNSGTNTLTVGVTGLISNPADNRLLTSRDSSGSLIDAESNLTFDGNLLSITGSGIFTSNLTIDNQTSNTIASFDNNKNLTSLSTSTYPNLTELSYVKGVTSSLQTQLNGKASTSHTHTSSDITNFNSSVSGLFPSSGNQIIYKDGSNLFKGSSNFTYNDSTNIINLIGDGTSSQLTLERFSSDTSSAVLQLFKSRGSYSSPLVAGTGDILGQIQFRTYNYNLGLRTSALISANIENSGTVSSNNPSAYITFSTSIGGGAGGVSPTERLRITGSGNVGIGTSSPSYRLDVAGTGNFSQNLLVNGTGVSLAGHTHTASNITDFNSSVSGLLTTIANSGDNRILTSTGTTTGINGESNLTFDGTTLSVSGTVIATSGSFTQRLDAPLSYNTISPAISGTTNDWDPGTRADVIRASGISSARINGLVSTYANDAILLYNVGTANNITLTHASGTSANQFLIPWAGDCILSPSGGAVLIVRDKVDNKWRIT